MIKYENESNETNNSLSLESEKYFSLEFLIWRCLPLTR